MRWFKPSIESMERRLKKLKEQNEREEAVRAERLARERRISEAWEDVTKDIPKDILDTQSRMRVVSTEKVTCYVKKGEIHNAILLIHEDGRIKVKRGGECNKCKYEIEFPEI